MYNNNATNEYFSWLLCFVENKKINVSEYTDLLWFLFNKEFVWVIPNDSNRAYDAMELRFEFEKGTECPEIDEKPVSVLEVLIRLASDWEHEIMYDFKKGDRSSTWFWVMIDNLGLLIYSNGRFDRDKVEEIVDVWTTRNFEKSGDGSIFPVKNWGSDQRKLEIWLQLQNFVMENGDFFR